MKMPPPARGHCAVGGASRHARRPASSIGTRCGPDTAGPRRVLPRPVGLGLAKPYSHSVALTATHRARGERPDGVRLTCPRWPGSTSRRSTPDPQSHCATAAYAVHHADLSDEQSRAEAGGPGSPTKISFRASTAPAMLSKDSCQTGALLDWHVVAVGRLPRVDAPTLNVPGQRKSSSRLLMSSPRGAHRVYPTKPRRGGTRMGHHDRIGIRWQQRVIPFRPARTVADTRRVIEDA